MGRPLDRICRLAGLLVVTTLILSACAPAAAPSPTAAPAKPAPPPAPAAQAAPTVAPAAAPAPTTAAAPVVTQAPAAAAPVKPVVPTGRLVVALPQFGTEAPFAWNSVAAEKPLWDLVYDSLIDRDPKTRDYRPGLALEWKPSADSQTWTFKLRQGVMFHENYGEMTAEDVKFTVEQNVKPNATGGSAPFFREQLAGIDTPDKYTVVMRFKAPVWDIPAQFAQQTGYQNITSKKYLETVGEQKAAQHPIGTGPYRHIEGRQGDYHRFEAVPNHWRQTPGVKELVLRRVADPGPRLAGLRSGEIDIGQVFGDYIEQAKRAGLRIHEVPGSAQYWITLPGLTTPEYEDYCPKCAWVGDPNDPKSLENARKVRLALNLAVNKKAIIDNLWQGYGAETPFSYVYFPFVKGYSTDWKIPPYDPQRAKQLLAEAGYPNGFEIKLNPMVDKVATDGPDVVEAVALDWDRVGVKVKRSPEDFGTYAAKVRARKTGVNGRPYGTTPADEPGTTWARVIYTKGMANVLAEGPFDKDIEAIMKEMDPEKRAKLNHDLGQKLYDGYYGVMIGVRATTWALSKKVGDWPTLAYSPMEGNYEYITLAGQ